MYSFLLKLTKKHGTGSRSNRINAVGFGCRLLVKIDLASCFDAHHVLVVRVHICCSTFTMNSVMESEKKQDEPD